MVNITKSDTELKIVTILNIFHQTPAASNKFVLKLTQLIIQTEQAMAIGKIFKLSEMVLF